MSILSDGRHPGQEPGVRRRQGAQKGHSPYESASRHVRGGGTPRLGTITDNHNTLANMGLPEPSGDDRKAARYRLLMAYAHLLWRKGVRNHRLTYCRRQPGAGHAYPSVWREGAPDGPANAGLAGLAVCGRGSYCPVCAAPIQAARGQRIKTALTRELESGKALMFVTLTVPHQASTALESSLEAVLDSFGRIAQKRTLRDLRRAQMDIGWENYVKTLEVNYGRNGFHPHLHIAVVLEAEPTPEVLARFTESLTAAWQFEVVKHGLKKPSAKHGVDVRMWTKDPGDLAAYLAKAVGAELTGNEFKTKVDDHSTMSMWQVMALATGGSAKYYKAFEHYIDVSRGRRFITSSRGFLPSLTEDDEAGIAEEAASEEEPQWRVPEFYINAQDWATADLMYITPVMLDTARFQGLVEAREFLESYDIETYDSNEVDDYREILARRRAPNGRFLPDLEPIKRSLTALDGGVGDPPDRPRRGEPSRLGLGPLEGDKTGHFVPLPLASPQVQALPRPGKRPGGPGPR